MNNCLLHTVRITRSVPYPISCVELGGYRSRWDFISDFCARIGHIQAEKYPRNRIGCFMFCLVCIRAEQLSVDPIVPVESAILRTTLITKVSIKSMEFRETGI